MTILVHVRFMLEITMDKAIKYVGNPTRPNTSIVFYR